VYAKRGGEGSMRYMRQESPEIKMGGKKRKKGTMDTIKMEAVM
jgi:hypothetical protein